MTYRLLLLLMLTTALTPVQARAQAEAPAAAAIPELPPAIRAMTAEEEVQYDLWVEGTKVLADMNDWAGAEEIATLILSRDEATFGPEHLRTARTLGWIAHLNFKRGAYSQAEPFYRRALEIKAKILGAEHPDIATDLNNYALNLDDQGRYTEAEPLLRRALTIRQKVFGIGHADTAAALANLATNLRRQGRPGEAEPLHRRALEIREKALGFEHLRTAISLHNLALTLKDLGRANEAADLWQRALVIREKSLGPEHPLVGSTLLGLAMTLKEQGRMAESEMFNRRSLAIFEKALGPEHPNTITSLHNLAATFYAQGRLSDAETLQRRTLKIREKILGPDHPDTADTLNNLAATVAAQGALVEAESLQRRAVTIKEKTLGPEHPSTATSLSNLAGGLYHQGQLNEAETLLRRALTIREKSLGSEHPESAASLNNLGWILSKADREEEAGALYRRSLVISEKVFGPQHPTTAQAFENVSSNALTLNKSDLALSYARQALISRRAIAYREGQAVDEVSQGRLQTTSTVAAVLVQRAAWSVAENGGGVAALRAEAFDAAQSAGSSGAGRALTRSTARASLPAAGQELVHDWEGLLNQRATLDDQLTRAAGATGPEADRKRRYLFEERVRLDEALQVAEQRLRTAHADYFDLINPRPVSLEALRTDTKGREALLRETEALILITPGITDKRTALQTGLVFVVTREGVAWAEMGMGFDELSPAITRMRASLDPGSMGSRAPDGGGSGFTGRGFDRATARALYKAIFGAPEIAKLLAGKDEWLITPQGRLLSLPFAALVADEYEGADNDPAALRATRWLGLEKAVTILPEVSNLQALRGTDRPVRIADQPFFGIGDPDFSRSRTEVRTEVAMLPADTGQPRGMRSYFRDDTGDPASIATLSPLPGTRSEILALAQSLGATPASYLLGDDATERQLRERNASGALGAARVVAFATHGLVSGDLKGTLAQPALALTPPAGTPASSEDDGLLTAGEAATLRLSADWVILSACNTAAGNGGEGAQGLTGLARAFFYAGADTLLVSHWRVGDAAATRLTTRAVEIARADRNLSRAAALRESMRELMQDKAMDGGNHSMSLAHPGVWAPFTLVGTER